LPHYFLILRNLSNNNLDSFLKYLYSKFHNKILSLKIAPIKKTATASYQPKSNQYKNFKLNKISPYIWDKYWDLRKITGYSISFIIRVFLEWELESMQKNSEILTGKPLLNPNPNTNIDLNLQFDPASSDWGRNNYEIRKKGNSVRNDIRIIFKDEFY
ncbi:MAG: hypothetical protein ACK4UJ_12635, partial [Leptonema sp. (in: bacteria)]